METELEAVNGRRVRAIEVFAHALHFFREHALKVHFKAPVYDSSVVPHDGHVHTLMRVIFSRFASMEGHTLSSIFKLLPKKVFN